MKKYDILKSQYIDVRSPKNVYKNIRLYRIIALRNIINGDVIIKEGSIGGFIMSEMNLSQEDESWVFNNSKVFDSAYVGDNSLLYENSSVFENAKVLKSVVKNTARIYGKCAVIESFISGNVDLRGTARVIKSEIKDSSLIEGDCIVQNSKIYNGASVRQNANVFKSDLSDVSEASGTANLENCVLKGRATLRSEKHVNLTLEHDVILNITSVVEQEHKRVW
jgi:ADP-glucose pyrophosphorylase